MNSPPAGWHPDPQDSTKQRYWDGNQWTQHTAPRYAPPSAAPLSQPAFMPRPPQGFTPSALFTPTAALTKPFWKQKRFAIPLGLFGALVLVGALTPKQAAKTSDTTAASNIVQRVETFPPVQAAKAATVVPTKATTTVDAAKVKAEKAAQAEKDRLKVEQAAAKARERVAEEKVRQLEGRADAAFTVCKNFVKDRLKAPGTAKFAKRSDPFVRVITIDDGANYFVTGWVDSQNGFGALLRADFRCSLEWDRDDGNNSYFTGQVESLTPR
jgi:Protein of unknown function (DUF2510)